MNKKIYIPVLVIFVAISSLPLISKFNNQNRSLKSLPVSTVQVQQPQAQSQQPEITFVGPRHGVVQDTPKEDGFWSFAVVASGALSRSGQPTINDFQWLKENGWKSDINLRKDGDRHDPADDAQIPGFSEVGLKYLRLQIRDGGAPSIEQAEEFLKFVTNPENLPAHVHCHAGVGRAGTMVALYRYSVQGWPMEKAIQESRKFRAGVNKTQSRFLNNWAQTHAPGSYAVK